MIKRRSFIAAAVAAVVSPVPLKAAVADTLQPLNSPIQGSVVQFFQEWQREVEKSLSLPEGYLSKNDDLHSNIEDNQYILISSSMYYDLVHGDRK